LNNYNYALGSSLFEIVTKTWTHKMDKPSLWRQTTVKEWQQRATYLNAHGQRHDTPIVIRTSPPSSLKRNIGTQQDAGENLKESVTGAPHAEVEEPSPEPSKKRRKRMPEWKVCQEFKDA